MSFSENMSNYVSVISITTSVFALAISIFAILMNVKLVKRQLAASTFQQYLQLELRGAKGQSEADLKIAFLLLVAQTVLEAFPKKQNWRELLKDQLEYYKLDLVRWKKEPRKYVGHYGESVDRLVSEVLADELK